MFLNSKIDDSGRPHRERNGKCDRKMEGTGRASSRLVILAILMYTTYAVAELKVDMYSNCALSGVNLCDTLEL